MIICVCKNISDSKINEELKKGKTSEQIIEHFGCTECKKCNSYIKKMKPKVNP